MLMTFITANLLPLLVAALALFGVGGAYLKGRKTGKEKAEQKHQVEKTDRIVAEAKHEVQTIKERANVEQDIDSRPVGDAADRLRNDWARD